MAGRDVPSSTPGDDIDGTEHAQASGLGLRGNSIRMASESSATSLSSAGESLVRSPATAIAALAGVLYALGFAVINSLLAYFGVSDFSGFDPRFVLTGVLLIFYLAFPVAPVFVALAVARLLVRTRVKYLRWPLAMVALALTFLLGGRFIEYLIDSQSYSPQPPEWVYGVEGWRLYLIDDHGQPRLATVGGLIAFYAACGMLIAQLGRLSRGGAKEPLRPAIIVTLALVLVTFSTSLTEFAYHKFRHLRAGYGGAAYGVRTFIIATKQAKALADLGLPLVDHDVVANAPVLYESKDSIILLPPPDHYESGTTLSFQIPKAAVEAVRWNSR